MNLKDCFSEAHRQAILQDAMRLSVRGFTDGRIDPALHTCWNIIESTEADPDTPFVALCFPILDADGYAVQLRFYHRYTLIRDFVNIFPYNHISGAPAPEEGKVTVEQLDRLGICSYLDFRFSLPEWVVWNHQDLEKLLGAEIYDPYRKAPAALMAMWLDHAADPPRTPRCFQGNGSRHDLFNAVSEYRTITEAWPRFTDRPLPPEEKFPMGTRASADGQFAYQYFGNGRVILRDYLGTRQVLELPSRIDGYRVIPVIPDGAFPTPTSVKVIVSRMPCTAFGVSSFANCSIRKLLGIREQYHGPKCFDTYYLHFHGPFSDVVDVEEMVWPLADHLKGTLPPDLGSIVLDAIHRDDAATLIDTIDSTYDPSI